MEEWMEITSISVAIGGLKNMKELVQDLMRLKASAEVQGKVIELQSQILSAQSSALDAQAEQIEVARRHELLNKEVARLRAWEEERSHYVLKEVSTGAFAYVQKEDSKPEEPNHWLCCQCYQDGFKSILQYSGYSKGHKVYLCNRCKSSLYVMIQAAEVVREPTRRVRFMFR
jgi:predicted SprT family Zn-dependent metalloprotease